LIADGVTAHPAVKDYLGNPVSRAESRTLGGARRMRRERCGAFHVGDAGGAVDPILGAGLTIALRTGVQAADAATAMAHGAPAAAVARRFARASARERRARRALASGLRFLSRHDLMARCSMRALRRAPALAAGLAGIAAGAPWPAANLGIPSLPSLL
jgi:flavin-dependent dehydrogenase